MVKSFESIKKMNLEEAEEYLNELHESYQIESREGAPDEDYLKMMVYQSGLVEAQLEILLHGTEFNF